MTKYYTLAIVHRDVFSMPRSANAVEPVRFSGKRNAVKTASEAASLMLRKQADRYHGSWRLEPPAEWDADHWGVSGVVYGRQGEVLYTVDAEVTGSGLCDHEISPYSLLKGTHFAEP